jgi:hypothetical protein
LSSISGSTQVEETRFPLFWKGYISTYPEFCLAGYLLHNWFSWFNHVVWWFSHH